MTNQNFTSREITYNNLKRDFAKINHIFPVTCATKKTYKELLLIFKARHPNSQSFQESNNIESMNYVPANKSLLKRIFLMGCSAVLSVSLVGCDSISKQDIGVVSGGAIGGLVGSRFGEGSGKLWTTGIGAVTGALVGGMIGHNMDKTDQLATQQALENSRTGQSTSWRNPDNGNRYTVKPVKTYKKANQYCREYITTAIIAGKTQQVYGTACRQPDGSWKMVK